MYQSYNLTIAAGGKEEIEITGAGVSCTASNLQSFRLALDDDPFGDFERGFDYRKVGGFKRVRLENPNSVALVVTMAVYFGDFQDRRTLVNGPQGINPVGLEALKDQGFIAYGGLGASAAQYTTVQLYNPAGSGKVLAVDAVLMHSPANNVIAFGRYDTALATKAAAGIDPIHTGGGAGVAEYRQEQLGATLSGVYQSVRILASTTERIDLKRPLILEAGAGLFVQAVAVNQTLNAGFEFLEIDG